MVINLFKKDNRFSQGDVIKGYIIEKILGEGRYGICYLVSKDNKKFIFKQLKKKMLKKSGDKIFYEGEILKKLHSPNILRCLETIEEQSCFAYILEFIEGKTVEEIIFKDNYVFNKKEILSLGTQLIDIIKYLHNNNVVHRDIRVPNVIYKNEQLYLIDFGLARYINGKKYTVDIDFSYLGDFLLHLYYTSYETKEKKERPWYEELLLGEEEMLFLKKLMGIEETYSSIYDVEKDFNNLKINVANDITIC